MDQLTGLRLFARVVERGSFTAVARELGVSQPSVSRQIAALEERLSARLLSRTTRRVKPTEAGLVFYERATRVLDDLAEAEAAVAHSVSSFEGKLRVAMSLAFGQQFVIPAARKFLTRFPKMRIELVINERYLDLIEEGIDVALRLGDLEDSTYIARNLGREKLVVVAAPRYIRAKGRPRTVDDLETHDGVVVMRRGEPSRWTFRTAHGESSILLTGPLHVDSIMAAHTAAREGFGVAVLPPYLASEDLRTRKLLRLLPDVEAVGLRVHAVYPPTRRLSSKVQSFIDHVARVIRSRSK